MKKEVSVLMATINVNEEKTPIAVMETADKETLRIAVESYILPMYNWGDEEKDEFDELVGSEMSRLYHLLLDEMDNLTIDNLAEKENERILKYYENPQLETYLVFVPNNYLESHKLEAENHDNFIAMGYHFGTVLTAEEFAKSYNAYQLGDLTNNDKYTMRTYTMDTKIIEYCPHCECEVLLDTKFEMQVCPVCGKKIAPCNLCNGFCFKDCPLNAI